MTFVASSSLKLLITGGAGFIGAQLVKYMLRRYPCYQIYNLDALTYAGDLARLEGIETPNYMFIKADLSDRARIEALFAEHNFEAVIHLAAETHVDRSIRDPAPFLRSNIEGTMYLLEAARKHWQPEHPKHCFYQISTDEVFGSLGPEGRFTEEHPYRPRSPYAASKAAADHPCSAPTRTPYQLPTLISHCSNNYGPFQYPEKLMPLAILHLLERRPVPMYDQGQQIREWIHVDDHVSAIDLIFHQAPRRRNLQHKQPRRTQKQRNPIQHSRRACSAPQLLLRSSSATYSAQPRPTWTRLPVRHRWKQTTSAAQLETQHLPL